MNKKILVITVIVIALAAGLVWQLYGHMTNNSGNPISGQKADRNLIEIFYLPHAPAEAIVNQVEPIIAKFPNYMVKKYNFEDPANKQKIAQYNLASHMPVAIFIGGQNSFTVNGKAVSLVNFPQGDAFLPFFEGGWSYDDLDKILSNQQ
jgi:hypothetical protein